jgi:hypothetical protein
MKAMRSRGLKFLNGEENEVKRISLTLALVAVAVIMVTMIALADSRTINFEPSQGYIPGTINGQNGWGGQNPPGIPINPAYDQAVVTNIYGYTSFGSQSWRISNAVTSGSFGDWPFSPSLTDEAGETLAKNSDGVFTYSDGTRQCHFEAQWDFASTMPTSEQSGLQISTSPDRGDGARMSFIRMKDLPAGLSVEFADYQDNAPYGSYGSPLTAAAGCGPEDNFVLTTIASGLDRSMPHTIRLTVDFIDGPRNDRVKVYVDGKLRHTGESWEDYYRWCTESGGGTGTTTFDQSRTVDSMIFQARTSGGEAPLTLGNGFLIDNLGYSSSAACAGNASSQKVTGGGQIQGDPVFSVDGILLSVPALVPSLTDPQSQASFGFMVQDGAAPMGNLEYNDKTAGVRIKVTSISNLTIDDGTCGSNMHAKFTGMADVIRSTGTSSEPFTVEVDDCGEPGSSDTFKIITMTYSNGPRPLIGGNIQIH